jgi:hypothetical protein
MSHHLPPVAVLIAHRGADDPNMVTIYCPAIDAVRLKAFVNAGRAHDHVHEADVR